MINDRDQILSLLIERVIENHPLRLSDTSNGLSDQTVLFGKEGLFDSLGLVALIVDFEQTLADMTGVSITLGDDWAMSESRSPFRTIGSLADYALMQINENG